MDKDRENRIDRCMASMISAGNLAFKTTIKNISKNGIMMSGIPDKFDLQARPCKAVINNGDQHFNFYLDPRWSTPKEGQMQVGFRIISPPLPWVKLLNDLNEKILGLDDVL